MYMYICLSDTSVGCDGVNDMGQTFATPYYSQNLKIGNLGLRCEWNRGLYTYLLYKNYSSTPKKYVEHGH